MIALLRCKRAGDNRGYRRPNGFTHSACAYLLSLSSGAAIGRRTAVSRRTAISRGAAIRRTAGCRTAIRSRACIRIGLGVSGGIGLFRRTRARSRRDSQAASNGEHGSKIGLFHSKFPLSWFYRYSPSRTISYSEAHFF